MVVSGRNADKSRRAVAELAALGAEAVAIEADVATGFILNASDSNGCHPTALGSHSG